MWEIDKLFHPTHYSTCDYFSMMELKSFRVDKRGPRPRYNTHRHQRTIQCDVSVVLRGIVIWTDPNISIIDYTKSVCIIPTNRTIMLALHKFSLQATIDHHGHFIYFDHYTTSVNWCRKNSSAATRQSLIIVDWYPKLRICIYDNVPIDHTTSFTLRNGKGLS